MAGWTIRHPWLSPAVGKRRPADEEGEGPDTAVSLPFKRRKHNTLEHGFARLTLNHTASPPLPSSSPSLSPSHLISQIGSTNISASRKASATSYSSTFDVPLPTSFAGSTSPESDVEMDVEVDTALHGTPRTWSTVASSPGRQSSKTEEPEHFKRVEISPVLLGHLKHTKCSPIIPITSPNTTASSSQALVLYRPLRPPSPTLSPQCAPEGDNTSSSGDNTVDGPGKVCTVLGENAMDVEL
ncbi:hypothetical protein SCLCIDRAFT_1215870 [Scleroderma citrinum Foug A]|uniref:Uncharacterized protein n=1 Tax=Scleroderma citrinum Foug A TaxID=1036808 RepID=A0A0C2ZJ53_9AGAM|nr:hypothetical protein SCLCIDRAFT_1215870 [Scleroderma citrinum Foug A]